MTCEVEWLAGKGYAWADKSDGRVILTMAGREFVLTPKQATDLAQDIYRVLARIEVPGA